MHPTTYFSLPNKLTAVAPFSARPKALSDNSPRNKAADLILQGLPIEAENILRCLAAGSNWVDEQHFTPLQKIVTGISLHSLEEFLKDHPETVNEQDATGRTALIWAAARGNANHVHLLLSRGADPNIMDMYHGGPLSYAADRGHTICARLLLKANAQTDPIIDGYKVGSPLNCAARNAKDPLLIRTLLNFGANPDACGIDGRTALIHVARTDNVTFAKILLEFGAHINAMASNGQTALTAAITNNSHSVLQLLLSHWKNYSTCPRISGPNLLRGVAQFGDLETIAIINKADHLRIKFDPLYSTGDFETVLKRRYDVNDDLVAAFDAFMVIVRTELVPETLHESMCA